MTNPSYELIAISQALALLDQGLKVSFVGKIGLPAVLQDILTGGIAESERCRPGIRFLPLHLGL